eukprot:TRINITY_DN15321_c0_g1_i1.p1 TRINITY_DN15321_c0_g1~~TRINITY_DN15321_c0_g1_i1.p1  ORF type:complete len:379 (-),score=55.37 TRINITY_DN15321_c0_g1_i1:122-1141(-)
MEAKATTTPEVNSLQLVNKEGAFVRKASTFRNWVKADGSSAYPPAAGRYHLYVSYACPWASRCLAFLALKGLDNDVIPVHTVAPKWGVVTREGEPEGRSWVFADKDSKEIGGLDSHDPLYGFHSLRQLYQLDNPEYVGRYTVPVLWDTETKKIVNNESSELVQMFNTEFNAFAKRPEFDLRPAALVERIDALNTWMYETINNGVYKCGFAISQSAYESAFKVLFTTLDETEEKLSHSRYLAGSELTEADIRLFVTIVRFDPVYVGHFKCNNKRIVDYPNLWNWVRDVYQYPGIKETVNMHHIKNHYYGSHPTINPTGVVPVGPDVDFDLPHNRASQTYN